MLEQQHIPTTFVQCIKTSWFLSLVACVVYSLCSSFAICTDFQCSWIVLRFKNWKVLIPFFCSPFFLLMSTSVTPNTFLGPVQAPFSTVLLGIYYLGTTRVYLTCCRKGSCSIYWPYVLRCTKRQIGVRCSQHPGFLYMPSYRANRQTFKNQNAISVTLVKAKNDNVKHRLWSARSITALSALRMLCTGLCNVFVAGG